MTADPSRLDPGTPRHAAPPRETRPSDVLVRVGAAVFLVGLVALVASVVPSVVTDRPGNTALVVASGALLPVGFGTALSGLLWAALRRRSSSR